MYFLQLPPTKHPLKRKSHLLCYFQINMWSTHGSSIICAEGAASSALVARPKNPVFTAFSRPSKEEATIFPSMPRGRSYHVGSFFSLSPSHSLILIHYFFPFSIFYVNIIKVKREGQLLLVEAIYIPALSLSSERFLVENNYAHSGTVEACKILMAARTTGSLPVANVQALAETCNRSNDKIPERYIRKEVRSEELITDHGSTLGIPVIDLNKLLDPQSSEECVKLVSACQNWGFFQVHKSKFLIFQALDE